MRLECRDREEFVSVFMNIFVVLFIVRCSLMEKQLKTKQNKKRMSPSKSRKGHRGEKMSKIAFP